MPPNKHNHRVFTPNDNDGSDGDGGNQPTARRRAKGPKRKSDKRRAVYNPSSRKARKLDEPDPKEKGTSKSTTPYNAVGDILSYRYATIAMDCGTLRKQLRKGLDANFKGNEDRDASRGKQSKKGLAANSKGDERRDAFQRIVLKTIREMVRIGTEVTRMAQQAFFGNLLKDMYDWYDTGGARGRPRNPAATETIVLADMVRFKTTTVHGVTALKADAS
ncbi:hypothetical protein BGX20_010056 [Mortierella sp. AD010]|nr:hypothetical protein BGX20_010056 [Mortierella sp. AD010]